jgi:hypothetical protein
MHMTRTLAALALTTFIAGCDAEGIPDDVGFEDEAPVAVAQSALTTNIQLDTSFGGDGLAFGLSQAQSATRLVDAGGGKVAFAATRYFNGHNLGDVGRTSSSGGTDASWNWNILWPGGDRVVDGDADPSASDVWASDVLVVSGKTFVTGGTWRNQVPRGYLMKLDEHGQVIQAFGSHGVVRLLPAGFETFGADRVFRDGQGRLLVMGVAHKGGNPITDTGNPVPYVAVGRFNATTGAIDTTYGTNGWATRAMNQRAVAPHYALGKGRSDVTVGLFFPGKVFRFDANGDFDNAFGTRSLDGGINGVAAAADGRVFVIGGPDYSITAFKGNGQKDTRFGDNGSTSLASPSFYDQYIEDLVFSDALGRLYVTGHVYVQEGQESRIVTTALRPDGAFDRSFGESGRALTHFPGVHGDHPRAIALQGEKLLVAGSGDADHPVPLARYIVDVGGTGEPCHANGTCDGDRVCKSETPEGFVV